MTCHRIGVAIICRGHGRVTRVPCAVGGCKRQHTRICDFKAGDHACSQKICDKHTTVDADGRDLCPFHARQGSLFAGGER